MAAYASWGNIPHVEQQIGLLDNRHTGLPASSDKKLLAYGKGRSYGDVCLNDGNIILPTSFLDKYISFDADKGIIRCEAGVCLQDLLNLIIPRGYFIPVTPGTKNVTIGGMIANDVHGKNHHQEGTFGRHVLQFELLRSAGDRLICSPTENKNFYSATIGGLGLTGLITWVDIQLKPIQSAIIQEETIPFADLQEFMRLTLESDSQWEYTVAWIDSFAKRPNIGRGVFFRGRHAEPTIEKLFVATKQPMQVPFNLPSWVLNTYSLKIFNKMYYSLNKKNHKLVPYDKFFYPLDGVGAWNRIYGKRGFYQYQCVVPKEDADNVIAELLDVCLKANAGSFLSVLKKFGSILSPGMLSFPREGYTLALDFPNYGIKTLNMLDALDDIVRRVGGAVYPAKDARMSPESFVQYYPMWEKYSEFIDPAFSSSFWRRVTAV